MGTVTVDMLDLYKTLLGIIPSRKVVSPNPTSLTACYSPGAQPFLLNNPQKLARIYKTILQVHFKVTHPTPHVMFLEAAMGDAINLTITS